MKYFITADVHSFYTPMMNALEKQGFDINNPDHIVCICGDAFDRGDETIKVFEFLKDMRDRRRLVYVRGNHEDLLFDCIDQIYCGRVPSSHHFSNGTVKTICQFCKENEWIIYDPTWRNKIIEVMQPVLDFIEDVCCDYAIIENTILVHGWIPVGDQTWKDARWTNGMKAWKQGDVIENTTIICGHYHCSWGWSHLRQERKEWPPTNRRDWQKSFEPFVDKGIVAIDSCCAYSGFLNCVVIETESNLDKFSNL